MSNADRTLWVGNLSAQVYSEILYEFFEQAGPVQSVTFRNSANGPQYRYAFVTFQDAGSVEYAVNALNGIPLFAHPLQLERKKKPKRPKRNKAQTKLPNIVGANRLNAARRIKRKRSAELDREMCSVKRHCHEEDIKPFSN